MKTSTAVVLTLGVLGLAGFGVAAYMTKDKGGSSPKPEQISYRAKVYSDGTNYYAAIFRDGEGKSVVEQLIGPLPTQAEAMTQGTAYVKGIGKPRFYVLYQNAVGAWMFDGFTNGDKIKTDGPFADEQAATTAGASWVMET